MSVITGKKFPILSVDISMHYNDICGHGKKENKMIQNPINIILHMQCVA
jgi:hypothetical protein